MFISEVPVDAQVEFNIPLSLSYQVPLDFATSSTAAVFRRLDVDGTLQLLGEVSPVVSIGGEVGISTSLPSVAMPLSAGFASIAYVLEPGYASIVAGHFPIRVVVNFSVDPIFDFDVYSGIQFNLINNTIDNHYDMTVDVGARFYVANIFVDISYALPVSVDFESTPATTGFWNNALTVGAGYRFKIVE